MVMQNVDQATATMRAISDRGVQLAIDDFGTGYSSMSLMKHFPVNTLKIDRCFVRDLGESAQDRAISAAIITLGRALGMTIVAEGVETVEQDAILRGYQCDEFQGFLFSRPVSADQIGALLSKGGSLIEKVASPQLVPSSEGCGLATETRLLAQPHQFARVP
jgi:EAL domain-containing protein (putative c-di-GMP-specific phosphodiesterase class I)